MYENGVSIELYPGLVQQDFQSGWQGLPRLMNGAPVDMYTEQMLECISTFQAFPPADIEQAQQAIKKIIDKFVMDNNPHAEHAQDLGPYWAVACLQRLKVVLQNWALDDRNHVFIRLIFSMNRFISGLRELREIKDDVNTLSKLR